MLGPGYKQMGGPMNIFITGGTSGIGLDLAKRYLAEGHRVGVCGRSLERFRANCSDERLLFFKADVANKNEIQKAIADFSVGNGLDILIANAGIPTGHKNHLPDFESGREVIQINLIGVLNTFEAGFRIMIEQRRGHLVAMGSCAGFNGLPGSSAYSASKAAVTIFCESLSIDLKSYGIDVTSICPGFIKTPLTDINPHPMPFLMPVEKAGALIKKAIEKKKIIYIFPWQMHFLVKLVRLLPRSLYVKLMRLKCFNYSV